MFEYVDELCGGDDAVTHSHNGHYSLWMRLKTPKPSFNSLLFCVQHPISPNPLAMHTTTSSASAGTSTKAATKKMATALAVYSNSRKGAADANGYGHAASKSPDTRTVILRPDQAAHMLDNNSAAGVGLITVPVSPSKDKVFECPKESLFYCLCIESMVLNRSDCPASLVEFGAGDGSPVISALLKSTKAPAAMPSIHAYEIGSAAAQLATTRAASVGLADVYAVRNSCFWQGAVQEGQPEDKCLIANPPYIPAPDASKLLMPALWGGVDGANLTRELLSGGFGSAMMMISAYSNPVRTLQHARERGYVVADFLVQPLPFGTYSSQDVVVQHLQEMKGRGEAFYRDTGATSGRRPYYFLAGVLFQKLGLVGQEVVDLSEELLSVMCAL